MELKDIENVLPLAPAQEVALRGGAAAGDAAGECAQLTCELRGALDADAFTRAWEHVCRRHQVLRALLARRRVTHPLLVVRREAKPVLVREDWRGLAPDERERRLADFLAGERRRGFDLSAAPLARLWLCRADEDRWLFAFTYHRLILDAESAALVWREALALHDDFSQGRDASLPPAARYEDYVGWLKRQDGAGAEAFHRQRLAGLAADAAEETFGAAEETFAAVAAPAGVAPITAQQHVRLPAPTTQSLLALRRDGVALDTLLAGAWALTLSRHAGETGVTIGVDIHTGTGDEGGGAAAGVFRHTMPLRIETAGDRPVLSWLRELEDQKDELRRHACCSVARLYESGVVPPGASLFETQVRVREVAPIAAAGRDGGLVVSRFQLREGATVPLSLSADVEGDGLILRVDYDDARFAEGAVEGMLSQLGTALGAMGAQPEQPVAGVPTLGEDELRRMLVEWNATASDYPRRLTIPQLFVEQVERAPEAVAVLCGERWLTYRELNARANRLAHHLRDLGVGPEVPVGVCIERSAELIVALLGVLKAGGAYVPLEAGYPPERLSLMLEDAGVPVLVTRESLLDELPAHWAHAVCVDGDEELISAQSDEDPEATAAPDNLAYVMYTSGSTGRPKGVSVTHRDVVRLVKETNYHAFDDSQVFLQFAPASFDASTFEIWGSLLNGARLVVMPPHVPTLEELGEMFRRHGVTTVWLTAGLFHMLVDERPEDLAPLRHLLAGGDVLSPAHVRRALRALEPGGRLVNGYGPTENTTFTCCHRMCAGDAVGESVPIGRPVSNTRVYLLDRGLRPVPVGAAGELYAGGDGLARGYHGRPDLTAERFVPDPFSGETGGRLYRTGDLARYLPDGRIEFIGRRDFQVKVRGFRIELGEIEAALTAHGTVRQCVVVARGQGAERQLVAYAVLGEGQTLSSAEMRSYLREKLPDYMMPAQLVVLDAFPLTPNGKVDRRALPAPAAATAEASDGYVAPRTPVEELLAGIWGDVLDVKLVGVRDDFFDLGGHSLLATQVVSRVREAFRASLPIRLLFESPTIEALAAYLESDRRASAEMAPPPLAPVPRDAALPLSFAQQRLWFLDQLEPGSAAYNIPAAVRLAGRLDASALERALAGVVKRHEALRTTFVAEGGQPRQSLSPAGPFALPLVDLSDRPAPAREDEARRLTEEEGRRPFDLARGPLLRALLLKLDDEEHIILLTMHHIVSDAWSMGLLIRELTALYESHVEDRPPTLPELPIQYADFAVWQRNWLTGETLAEQLAYWRRQLGGELPSLRLSAETPGGPAGGGSHGFSLRPDLTESLKSLSRGEGTTLFMTLLAAFKSLLCLHAGQEDIVVGTPVAGRTRAEIEPLIGFFVNTLVLRTDLSGDPTFRELLRRVREVTLSAYAHQDVPFERLVEELRPDRAAAESPLFQVAFTLDNTRHEAVELPGLTLSPWAVETGATRYGLIAALLDAEAGLFGSLQYDTRLFSAAAVARLAEHYETLLERVAAEPETRLSELRGLLAEAERRREDARRQEFREARGRRLRDAKSKAAAQPSAQEELVP